MLYRGRDDFGIQIVTNWNQWLKYRFCTIRPSNITVSQTITESPVLTKYSLFEIRKGYIADLCLLRISGLQ